ncbi:type II toxin-antitoxin system VapC family toxin [Pseudomonas fluorescens]
MTFNDIRHSSSTDSDHFFVDTNVWYWATYISSKTFLAKRPKDYQVEHYPDFIESALNNKATLYYSPLILVELTNLIERSEWEIYKAYQGDKDIPLKRFRNIPVERKAVLEEIKTAWASIQGMANELPTPLGEDLSTPFISIVESYTVDGYDALYYHFMKENGISNIITDDKDFRGLSDITLYTCYEK